MRFLLGLGVGYAIGLLIAPDRGEVTRQRLVQQAQDLAQAQERKVEQSLREVAEKSRERAGDIGSEVGRRAAEAAVQAVSDELLGDKGTKTA